MSNKIEILFKEYTNQLTTVGKIILVYNRLEWIINALITTTFCVTKNTKQELTFLISDCLNNQKIFGEFEQKINFAEAIIKRAAFIVKYYNFTKEKSFNDVECLKVCMSIRKIQRSRNKIVHLLNVFQGNKMISGRRKKESELLLKKGSSFSLEEIDVDKVLKESLEVLDQAEKVLLFEGMTKIIDIFNS